MGLRTEGRPLREFKCHHVGPREERPRGRLRDPAPHGAPVPFMPQAGSRARSAAGAAARGGAAGPYPVAGQKAQQETRQRLVAVEGAVVGADADGGLGVRALVPGAGSCPGGSHDHEPGGARGTAHGGGEATPREATPPPA